MRVIAPSSTTQAQSGANATDAGNILSRRKFLAGAASLLLGGCSTRHAEHDIEQWREHNLNTAPPLDLAPQQKQQRQSAARPAVVARNTWTQRAVGSNADAMGGIKRLTLHHTGEHLSSSGLHDTEVIQRIERYHAEHLGWAAIGYHFLVGTNGTVYEGRPIQWQGAHCGGDNNRHNIGVTVIGHFDLQLPNSRQIAGLTQLLNGLRSQYRIPTRECYGHRDWKATICPGTALYNWLKRYKAA